MITPVICSNCGNDAEEEHRIEICDKCKRTVCPQCSRTVDRKRYPKIAKEIGVRDGHLILCEDCQ